MKMSSPYCRSEMRPEYLAEFEAAGVPPYCQVSFPTPVTARPPEQLRTRKVILETSARTLERDPVGSSLAAAVAGAAWVFLVGFALPMVIALAFLGGILKAGTGRRRRSW